MARNKWQQFSVFNLLTTWPCAPGTADELFPSEQTCTCSPMLMRMPRSSARPSLCTPHTRRIHTLSRGFKIKERIWSCKWKTVTNTGWNNNAFIQDSVGLFLLQYLVYVCVCVCVLPLHECYCIAAAAARGNCSTPWFYIIVLILPFSPPLSVSATWLRFLDHSSFLFVFLSYFPPIHPAFPPLHCHNKAGLPGAFHRALSSR